MRKIIGLSLSFALVLAAVVSVPALAAPSMDKVTGAGTTEGVAGYGDFLHFTVSAHSGPSGEDPKGNIVYRWLDEADVGVWPGGKPRSADIVCMNVDGNQAVVIAEWKKGDRPFGNSYPWLFLAVEDNGNPSGDTPDRAFVTGVNSPNCGLLSSGIGNAVPLVKGNVQVVDAAP